MDQHGRRLRQQHLAPMRDRGHTRWRQREHSGAERPARRMPCGSRRIACGLCVTSAPRSRIRTARGNPLYKLQGLRKTRPMTEGDEKQTLHRYLRNVRGVLLWKLEGLSDYDI